MNKRNGETEEEEEKAGNSRRIFDLASALSSPPFLRSSC